MSVSYLEYMIRFLFCLTIAGFLMWCSLSDKRMVTSPSELTTIFHCLIRDYLNLEDEVPDLFPPRTGWPNYTFGQWVPLLLPVFSDLILFADCLSEVRCWFCDRRSVGQFVLVLGPFLVSWSGFKFSFVWQFLPSSCRTPSHHLPTWRTMFPCPPGKCRPSYTSGHWSFLFITHKSLTVWM
jgi:hypothetical protein